jgi:hypothetical protein
MDVSRLEAGRLKGSFRQVVLGVMTRDLAVSVGHWRYRSRGQYNCPGWQSQIADHVKALFRGAIEKVRQLSEAHSNHLGKAQVYR